MIMISDISERNPDVGHEGASQTLYLRHKNVFDEDCGVDKMVQWIRNTKGRLQCEYSRGIEHFVYHEMVLSSLRKLRIEKQVKSRLMEAEEQDDSSLILLKVASNQRFAIQGPCPIGCKVIHLIYSKLKDLDEKSDCLGRSHVQLKMTDEPCRPGCSSRAFAARLDWSLCNILTTWTSRRHESLRSSGPTALQSIYLSISSSRFVKHVYEDAPASFRPPGRQVVPTSWLRKWSGSFPSISVTFLFLISQFLKFSPTTTCKGG